MPEAAAAPLAESLLVDSAVTGGLSATAMASGLGGAGTVGSLFGSAGAGLGASGLGGIAGLSSLPVATAMEAAPLAMGQIGAALAPTATGALAGYGLGGAATGLGAGLGTSAGLGAGSTLGLGGATAGTVLGTGAELAGSALPTISGAGQLASAGFQISPEELEAARNVVSSATPELTQNQAIQQAIAETAKNTGLASTLPNAGIQGTLAQGTADLVGGGIQPTFAESLGGIKDLAGSGIQSGIDFIKKHPYETAGAAAAYKLLNSDKTTVPGQEKYSGPLSKFHYDQSKYTPYIQQPPANPYKAQYTSYAKGGIADLGGYSDGGQMLKGPGDGMSDSIPATIANKQPARLANDEFVVPADVVSHLGNGSSDAGAKQLYSMMNRVRKARTGNTKQGRQINPSKYMPA